MKKSRGFVRRRTKKTSAVKKLKKDVRELKKQVQADVSYTYHTTGDLNMANTGTITALLNIAQGDDDGNRDGDRVNLIDIFMKYTVKAQTNNSLARVMLVLYKHADTTGTAFALADLIQNPNPAAMSLGMYNTDEINNFLVLYDETIPVSTDSGEFRYKSVYRKVNKVLKYEDTTTNEYTLNQPFLVFFSNATTDYPLLQYNIKLRYNP